MKKIKVWAFTANGIGWRGPITMYFDSRDHAEDAYKHYTYADSVHYVGMFAAVKFGPAYPRESGEAVHVGQLYPTAAF